MEKADVVTLNVVHHATHARETLAEAQVVRGIVSGWFALGPVPVPAILEVDHIDCMVVKNFSAGLQPKVVNAAQALFKNLRSHDRRSHRENHATFQVFHGATKESKISGGRAADR